MRRFYSDLHLCPDLGDDEQVENMIKKSSQLGYHLIGIRLPKTFPTERTNHIRRVCKEEKIEFVSRIDLAPKTSKELIRSIRKIRRRFEIVSVICQSKNVARQAAKDRRVDLLNFPSIAPRRRFFDKAEQKPNWLPRP